MIKGGSHLLQQYQRSEWCRCKRPIVFGKEFELCVLPVRKSLRVLDFLLFSVFRSSSFVFFSARRYFPFVPCITCFVGFVLLPCFRWWRIRLFCYFVSVIHPPCAACESEVCVIPLRATRYLLSCVLAFLRLIYYLIFVLFHFFDINFGHRLFNPVIFLSVLRCLLGFGF